MSPLCLLWGQSAQELRQWERPKAYIIAKARQTSCNRRIVSLIDAQARAQVAMNPDTIHPLLYLYVFVAVVASICIASSLEERLKARLPATRPYRWGFYNGCMGSGLRSACGGDCTWNGGGRPKWQGGGFRLLLRLYSLACGATVCGWFIIQRKRWAWVLGTVLSCNILVWIINYIYGRNRWGEFGGQAYGSAGTEDEGTGF